MAMKNLIFTAIFLTGSAMADDLTIPNTFQAGTPARAAEMNANFSAVETSVDDNAADMAIVSQNVATYVQNISSNAQGISSNAQNISSNDQDIDVIAQNVSSLIAPAAFNFVGFSSAQVDGGAGFFGMHAACQADFGPDSRMATSEEIIESTIQPTLAAPSAWVREKSGSSDLYDYSGARRGPDLTFSCLAWTSNTLSNANGLTVLPNGGFQLQGCRILRPVACSMSQ
jgi:hypothetical protein